MTLDTPELLMAEGLAAESAPPGEARAAPLLLGADSYELHASVLQTARDAGYSITDAPGITVLSGGVPAEVLDDTIFLLPPGPGPVTLRSRRFTPADVDPAGGDARELGICLARIVLDGTAIDLAGPACGDGFLPPEGEPWRWTTGEATLHLAPRDTESVLELILSPGLHGRYWLPPALTPR